MAERRMRLKRGKAGDTGVVLPPVSPVEVPRERPAFDEELVEQIAMTAIGGEFDPPAFEVAKQAVRLTMATMSMKQNLATPSRSDPSSTRTDARVDRVSVSIADMEFATHHEFGRTHRVVTRPASVSIFVEGYHQHPRTLLQAALDQFDEKATYGMSVSSRSLR